MQASQLTMIRQLESDHEAHDLIEAIPAIAWMARGDGSNASVSRRWTEFTGLSAGASAGWGWCTALHPADAIGFVDAWRACLSSGEPLEAEARFRSAATGEYRWFAVHAEALADRQGWPVKWYGLLTDIEERKRSEYALRASEQRFRALVELSSDVYWETDENHRFTRQDFPQTIEDAPSPAVELGRTRWEIPYAEPGEEAWRAHRDTLDAHLPFRDFELARPMPSGARKYVSVSGVPRFDEDGRFIGYCGVGRHITARKRGEEERARLEARLRQAETMEGIGRFASGIAHDFNNVLSSVLSYGEMLLEDARAGSECARNAAQVLVAARRARELVREILAYARGQTVTRARLDLREPVLEAVELVRGSLPERVKLTCSMPPRPLAVNADATQLHRMVTNLCTNAVHALEGEGRIDVAVERIACDEPCKFSHGAVTPGHYAAIRVEDSGRGMDEATLARIFEPFFTTKGCRGTGLGLALVHSIVSEYGGAMDVKSCPGTGSRFSIFLPAPAGA